MIWIACALASPELQRELDALVQPVVDAQVLHHVVIGVRVDGKNTIRAWGDGAKPDAVFEIGSVTKALTGLLLADAIARGEVELDATLADRGLDAPTWEGQPISLVDLATHTSGLPRLPAGFKPADPRDPYAGTTEAWLFDALRQAKLADAPGRSYAYSNLGTAVLGQVLAKAAGKPYETLVVERIAAPLAMSTLTVGGPAVQGHDADLAPVGSWTLGPWAPAGGARANAADLLKLVDAGVSRQGPLAGAFATSTAKQRDLGDAGGIGFGWHLAPGGTVWHNGQTGGHHALVAFHPERGVGVVALGDVAADEVDKLGFAALALALGNAPAPVAVRKPAPEDPALTASRVGRYGPMNVTLEGDALMLTLPDQPAYRLWPAGGGRYFLRAAPVEVQFDGKVLIFDQEGIPTQRFKR